MNPASMLEPYPVREPQLAATGDTLIVHALSEPESLNPLFATHGATTILASFLFEQLVVKDARHEYFWNDRMVEAISEERGTTRLTLRDSLLWHDGEPLTAADVEFSWAAILDPKVPAVYWKGRAERVASLRAEGPRTVVIDFGDRPPAPPLRLQSLAFPVVPAHRLDIPEERQADPTLRTSDYYNDFARSSVVGNGLFRFVSWQTNDQVVLERWEENPAPPRHPSFGRLIYKLMPDRNLALLEFMAGKLDMMYMAAQQAALQSQDPAFAAIGRKAMFAQQTGAYIRWNLRSPLFEDQRVRLALAHTFDVERVLRDVTYGLHRRPVGFLDLESKYANQELAPHAFDLERAGQLLDEAGWLADEEDGWRYRDVSGERLQLRFQIATFQAFRDFALLANIWQQDLRRIGVEMSFRTYERGAFTSLRQSGDFDGIADYIGGADDADQWRSVLTTGAIKSGLNFGGYSNPKLDELFERGQFEQDPEERLRIYREAHALEHADPALLPLFNFRVFMGIHKRIRGLEFGPNGVYGVAGTAPEDWPSRVGPGWWVRADEAPGTSAGKTEQP